MADASDVIIPPGTEARFSFAAGLDVAQVHAEGTTDGNHAPWSFVGV